MPAKNKRRAVAIDTETTGLNAWTGCKPFAVGMYFDDDTTKYWEWPVDPKTRQPLVNPEDVAEINAYCCDETIDKYFWNAKFDIIMLEQIGVRVAMPYHEGVFMLRAIDNLRFSYKLKPTAQAWLDIPATDEKDLQKAVAKCRRVVKKLGWNIGEDAKADYWLPASLLHFAPRLAKKYGLVEAANLCKVYCLGDVERTLKLCELYEYGMNDLGVRDLYNFEMSLLSEVTIDMEKRGIRVDEDRMAKVMRICEAHKNEALEFLKEYSGNKNFNPGSSQQVVDMLFIGRNREGVKLKSINSSKGGQPKVDAEALMPYRHTNKAVDALLKYRANAKALSSFFNPYKTESRVERHGRILRASWNQWGTLTGRFSSIFQVVSNPKTTNSRSAEYVIDIRQVFIPRRDRVWYCPDYSQVEVIIFADIAQEPTMLKAIRDGDDIHAVVTDKIWGGEDNPRVIEAMKKVIITAESEKRREGKDFEDYDYGSKILTKLAEDILKKFDWKLSAAESSLGVKIYRKLSKGSTFNKIFGGGVNGLMSFVKISVPEARQVLSWYDTAFPTMVQRMKLIERRGKADGYLINPYGMRLKIDPYYAYRGVNYLVQSSAACLMKRGMLKCARMLKERTNGDAQLLATIHDELMFEFKQGADKPEIIKAICDLMSDHEGAFSVNTPVDMEKVTERWSIKEKVTL